MAHAPSLFDAVALAAQAASDCQSVVRAIRQLPGHAQVPLQPGVQALATSLGQLEAALAQVAAQGMGRPVPVPNPEQAGVWCGNVAASMPGWRERASQIPVSPAAVQAAQTIRQQAQALGRQMSGAGGHSAGVPAAFAGAMSSQVPMQTPAIAPPQAIAAMPRAFPPVEALGAIAGGALIGAAGALLPAAQFAPALGIGVAGAGLAQLPPQSPTPAVPSDFGRKVGGGVLSILSIVGTAIAARYAYKHENGQVAPETQETERLRGQQVLDSEAPGHRLDLLPTPGGGWIASTKAGKRAIARASATDPTDAIRQVVTDTIRRDSLQGALAGPGVEVIAVGDGEGRTLDPAAPIRPEAAGKRPKKRKAAAVEESEEPSPTESSPPAA